MVDLARDIDDLVSAVLGPQQRQILEALDKRPVMRDPDTLIGETVSQIGDLG